MRRKMLLFSPSLLAETLRLWCSSSRSVRAFFFFFLLSFFFWTPGAPIVINDSQLCRTIAEAPRHIPHQTAPRPLFHKLHNKHTGLCRWLFVLPPHETEGYFPLPVYRVSQTVTDSRRRGFLCSLIGQFLVHQPSLAKFPRSPHPASSFLPTLRSAPVHPFVSPSPAPDSKQAVMHVWCLHLFPPSNLCCQVVFPVFGRPGFHVCAERYLGVLTHSSVFSMKQTVAGNWWGFTATGCSRPTQPVFNPVNYISRLETERLSQQSVDDVNISMENAGLGRSCWLGRQFWTCAKVHSWSFVDPVCIEESRLKIRSILTQRSARNDGEHSSLSSCHQIVDISECSKSFFSMSENKISETESWFILRGYFRLLLAS